MMAAVTGWQSSDGSAIPDIIRDMIYRMADTPQEAERQITAMRTTKRTGSRLRYIGPTNVRMSDRERNVANRFRKET